MKHFFLDSASRRGGKHGDCFKYTIVKVSDTDFDRERVNHVHWLQLTRHDSLYSSLLTLVRVCKLLATTFKNDGKAINAERQIASTDAASSL